MTTNHARPDDPDHELVDRLIAYHRPATDEVVRTLEAIREAFATVAHMVVDRVPRTPDRTIAIRKIHDASQASIGALACNQEE